MPNETRNGMPEARAAAPAPASDPARRARIAIAAYYRAERRGFAPGRENEDWLEAECALDRGSAAGATPGPDAAARVTSQPEVPADTGAKPKARKSRGNHRGTTRR